MTIFKFPSVVDGKYQHGIVENGEVDPLVQTKKYYEAPTDWSIYVVFTSNDGYFEFETETVWYTQADEAIIENVY